MLMYEESKILIMLIITIIAIIIYTIYNWLKPKKYKEEIKKVSVWPTLVGILIIVSSFIIVLYEVTEYKYAVSLHPYFGNMLVNIRYMAYFILMIATLCGTFFYRKYAKVLSLWLKVIYIIGIILVIVLSVYIYLYIIRLHNMAVVIRILM